MRYAYCALRLLTFAEPVGTGAGFGLRLEHPVVGVA